MAAATGSSKDILSVPGIPWIRETHFLFLRSIAGIIWNILVWKTFLSISNFNLVCLTILVSDRKLNCFVLTIFPGFFALKYVQGYLIIALHYPVFLKERFHFM